jgi:hypothetical protein
MDADKKREKVAATQMLPPIAQKTSHVSTLDKPSVSRSSTVNHDALIRSKTSNYSFQKTVKPYNRWQIGLISEYWQHRIPPNITGTK